MNIKRWLTLSVVLVVAIPANPHKLNTKRYECEAIIREFGITKEVKSLSGWKRTCDNEKISLYTTVPLTKEDEKILCQCLIFVIKNDIDYLFIPSGL